MNNWERRSLSDGEIALGRTMFADEIDWARIHVVQVPKSFGFSAMVPRGRTILFSKWRARRDFSRAPATEQAWLIHELVHVWQARRGVVLALAKIGALGRSAYSYAPKQGARLKDYNIERQAEIARHLFLARCGCPERKSPPVSWLEDIWARRR